MEKKAEINGKIVVKKALTFDTKLRLLLDGLNSQSVHCDLDTMGAYLSNVLCSFQNTFVGSSQRPYWYEELVEYNVESMGFVVQLLGLNLNYPLSHYLTSGKSFMLSHHIWR